MLVLSRKRDESIVLGDDIVLTIVDIRGDKVRLGINAPESVVVDRLEVYERKRREGSDLHPPVPAFDAALQKQKALQNLAYSAMRKPSSEDISRAAKG